MKEKQLIRGNEYIYLPNPTDFDSLQKIYFVFIRKTKMSNFKNKQYIFVKDIHDIDKYKTINDYEADLNKLTFIGFDKFVIDDNLSFFRKYSEKKEDKILKMYDFFVRNEKIYKKLLKYTKLYSSENETFFWSKVFTSFRKNMLLYRTRFYLLLFLFIILGTLKFAFYIPIFLIDIMKSSIVSYRDYKKNEAKVKFYENDTYMNRMILNVSEEEFNKRKENAQNNLSNIKEKYINSNIAIFTLLIAFGTLIFTLVENTKSMREIQNQNDDNNKRVELIEIENLNLKNELKIEKSKNQILEQIIDSSFSILSRMETENMKIEDDIKKMQLEMNKILNTQK